MVEYLYTLTLLHKFKNIESILEALYNVRKFVGGIHISTLSIDIDGVVSQKLFISWTPFIVIPCTGLIHISMHIIGVPQYTYTNKENV